MYSDRLSRRSNCRTTKREQQEREKEEQRQEAERKRNTQNKEREERLATRNQNKNTEEKENTDSQTKEEEDIKITRATDEGENKTIEPSNSDRKLTQDDIHTHQSEHTEFVRNFHNQEDDKDTHTESRKIKIEDIVKITNLMQLKNRTFKYQLKLRGYDRPKWIHQSRLPTLPEHMIAEIRERRTNKGKIRKKHKYKRTPKNSEILN